jgi:hypothetical protein
MTLPAAVLDLTNWKLTLPIGTEKNKPTEIKQPRLASYEHASYFVTLVGGGVRFRAPVNGVTTSGSSNPRSELRELRPGGDWSSSDGQTHTMVIDQAFTHLPNARTDGGTAGVVGGQIHDADNDICVFRLEGKNLWLTSGNNAHYKLITDTYELGTRFKATFSVLNDVVSVYFNGQLVDRLAAKFARAYFKAGAYTQANSSNSKPNDVTNYGEVVVYSVTVAHGTTPPEDDPPATEEPPPVIDPVPTGDVVMIIRHGEKPVSGAAGVTEAGKSDTHSLTAKGWRRAGALAPFFAGGRVPRPTKFFASKGKSASMRPLQTVQEAAKVLGLPIDTSFDVETVEAAFGAILKKSTGVTVVSMEHTSIVNVAKAAFGVPVPATWPDARYDVVWLFAKYTDATWRFTQVPQLLLAGDLATGI